MPSFGNSAHFEWLFSFHDNLLHLGRHNNLINLQNHENGIIQSYFHTYTSRVDFLKTIDDILKSNVIIQHDDCCNSDVGKSSRKVWAAQTGIKKLSRKIHNNLIASELLGTFQIMVVVLVQ